MFPFLPARPSPVSSASKKQNEIVPVGPIAFTRQLLMLSSSVQVSKHDGREKRQGQVFATTLDVSENLAGDSCMIQSTNVAVCVCVEGLSCKLQEKNSGGSHRGEWHCSVTNSNMARTLQTAGGRSEVVVSCRASDQHVEDSLLACGLGVLLTGPLA